MYTWVLIAYLGTYLIAYLGTYLIAYLGTYLIAYLGPCLDKKKVTKPSYLPDTVDLIGSRLQCMLSSPPQ